MGGSCCSAGFLCSNEPKTPAYRMALPTLRLRIPTSINLIQKAPVSKVSPQSKPAVWTSTLLCLPLLRGQLLCWDSLISSVFATGNWHDITNEET